MNKKEITMNKKTALATVNEWLAKGILSKHQFWAKIIAQARVHYRAEYPYPAACYLSGSTINFLISDRLFDRWTADEGLAVMIHEIEHIARLHQARKQHREHRLFNVACDIEINQLISGLPKEGMFAENFKFALGLSAEEYYLLLLELEEEQEDDPGEGPEPEEGDEEGNGGTPGENPGNEPGDCPNGSGTSGKEGNPNPGEKGEEDKEGEASEESEDPTPEPGEEEGNGARTDKEGRPMVEDLRDPHEGKEMGEHVGDAPLPSEGDGIPGVLKGILERAKMEGQGNLPGDLNEILTLLGERSQVSWEQAFRQYLSAKVKILLKRVWRMPNRRGIRTAGVKSKAWALE